MRETEHDLSLSESDCASGPSFEERLSGATRDYELLNGEHLAELGI